MIQEELCHVRFAGGIPLSKTNEFDRPIRIKGRLVRCLYQSQDHQETDDHVDRNHASFVDRHGANIGGFSAVRKVVTRL